MWNLKSDTNELIYKNRYRLLDTENKLQIKRKDPLSAPCSHSVFSFTKRFRNFYPWILRRTYWKMQGPG